MARSSRQPANEADVNQVSGSLTLSRNYTMKLSSKFGEQKNTETETRNNRRPQMSVEGADAELVERTQHLGLSLTVPRAWPFSKMVVRYRLSKKPVLPLLNSRNPSAACRIE
jgi:hypothetical protein